MERALFRNKQGVTLVEMMVALTVLLFVSLSMMQVAIVGINSNRQNSLRDEGTRLATKYLNEIRFLPISNRTLLVTSPVIANVPVNYRRDTVNFQVTQEVEDNAGTTWDTAKVTVAWGWRGEMFNTVLSTIVETEKN